MAGLFENIVDTLKVYKTQHGVTLSTEKNVKEGFIYPTKTKKGEIRWRKEATSPKRKYDFTKKAPIPEMDNNRFKFDVDLNTRGVSVYVSDEKA